MSSIAAFNAFAAARIAAMSRRVSRSRERPSATIIADRRSSADIDVSALSAALISRAFWAGVSLNFTMADCTLVFLCGGPRGRSPLGSCGPRPHGLLSELLSQRRCHEVRNQDESATGNKQGIVATKILLRQRMMCRLHRQDSPGPLAGGCQDEFRCICRPSAA
jgi:hypothetical protein